MIRIFPDYEALSLAAADWFIDQAAESVSNSGSFCIALSGGKTPRRMYELLAQSPRRERVAWEHLNIFWGDDRCVTYEDPSSNYYVAEEILLEHVPVRREQVHSIPCSQAQNPMVTAQQYERVLREFFKGYEPRLDLVLLGLGADGRVAALFPGSPAARDNRRWVADVYLPEMDMHRITLTAPFINQSAHILVLVSGAGKAVALREALENRGKTPRLPVHFIQPVKGEMTWLVDQPAASLLSPETLNQVERA